MRANRNTGIQWKGRMGYAEAALKRLGIDFHVGATLAMRLWVTLAGGVTLLVIPKALSRAEQGYYFTFSSVLALQVFFELGFNYVVVQIVGHEMSRLQWNGAGELEGAEASRNRVACLLRLLGRWYLVISVLFFGAVGGAGALFFSAAEADVANWAPAWWLVVLGTAANLFLSPFLAVLEGTGMVGQVARVRLVQSCVGYLLFWAALAKGGRLLAAPAISLAGAACSGYWLWRHGAGIIRLARTTPRGEEGAVRWRRDIFPLQWRIAVSWTSGYLIFQLFNPLVFALAGPIEAGRLGMALAVFSAVLSLAMSWITAKTPTMAMLVARGDRAELNGLFRPVWVRTGVLNAALSAGVIVGCWYLAWLGHPIASRIAGTSVLVCIAINNIANHSVFAMAAYMRAHKEEPMLWTSVVVGLATLVAVRVAVSHGLLAVAASCMLVTLVVALPWTWLLFRRYYPA
jgi:hypothetical protein